MLRLEGGRLIEVRGMALLGRNPRREDHEADAHLVALDHDTVSKTHLAVGVTDGVAWAVDRSSTNGTVYLDEHGREMWLTPGQRTRLEVGGALRLGGVWAQIEELK
jgi:hypothetical protein